MSSISGYFNKVKTWCGDDIPLEKGLSVALNYLKTPNAFLHIATLACAKEEGLKTLAGFTVGVIAYSLYSKRRAESGFTIVDDKSPSSPAAAASPPTASSKPISFLEWIGTLAKDKDNAQKKMMAKIIFVAAIILIQLFKGDFLHLKTVSALAFGALEGQHLLMKLQNYEDDKAK